LLEVEEDTRGKARPGTEFKFAPMELVTISCLCWTVIGGGFFDFFPDPDFESAIPFSSSYFRFIVEFQWFLMALSVRPGNSLAILAHLKVKTKIS
jgi:hypothetical protein